MATTALTILILGLALGTYLLRFVPVAVMSRVRPPEWARDWLGLVPGAVLAASLAESLFIRDDELALTWTNLHLLAAVPVLLVAWRTRSVILTMLSGMAAYALLQRLLT